GRLRRDHRDPPEASGDTAFSRRYLCCGVPGRLRWVTMVPPADGRDFGGRASPWHAPPGTGARPLATTGPPRRGMRVHRAEGADTAGPPPSLLSEPLPLRPAPPLLPASPTRTTPLTRTTPPTLFEGSFMLWTLLRRHLRPYRGHV